MTIIAVTIIPTVTMAIDMYIGVLSSSSSDEHIIEELWVGVGFGLDFGMEVGVGFGIEVEVGCIVEEGKYVTVVVTKTVLGKISVLVEVIVTTGSSTSPAVGTFGSMLCSTTKETKQFGDALIMAISYHCHHHNPTSKNSNKD